RSDLDFENEYNTYKINGIPKKPIANPGKETILATLKPEKTNFLYFVATGNGGHSFTSNLKDHNKKVQDYRNTIKDK
ncbi:MAG: endolytic transglycosylase MltG, partial [Rickettsiales bacterium]|nr:endolytic transglycosylase MltG [Rickettsiales bacterium]